MDAKNYDVVRDRVWKPLDVLYNSSYFPRNGLLLLNVSLRKNIRHLHRVWNSSPMRCVLDGAGRVTVLTVDKDLLA